MSNMLRLTGITYFQLPNAFFSPDITKNITKLELLMYLYLWKESQHNSLLTLKYSGRALAQALGVAETKIGAPRTGLVELGLIMVEKVDSHYEYTLTDPDSGLAISNPRLQRKGYDYNDMTPFDNCRYYVARLEDAGIVDVEQTANGIKARCPLCKGDRQTFEVQLKTAKFHCHKCEKHGRLVHFEQALAMAMGHEISGKEAKKRIDECLRACGVEDVTLGEPEAKYFYADEHGEVKYEIHRYPNKVFRVATVNKAGDYEYKKPESVGPLLYRLPQVLEADVVFIAEGEKDADRLTGLGFVGSTNSFGANKWQLEHTEFLEGKRVVVFGDNDPRGERHADNIVDELTNAGIDTYRVHIPIGFKDVSDYLESHSVHDFLSLIPEGLVEMPATI
jgi:hypothetical protein